MVCYIFAPEFKEKYMDIITLAIYGLFFLIGVGFIGFIIYDSIISKDKDELQQFFIMLAVVVCYTLYFILKK